MEQIEFKGKIFQSMDTLLMDIKNFLMKLEDGQLDIEAGQWELHKDLANVKRTVEDLKKLKEDVELMRLSNAEQMGLIKNLEAKLEVINKHYQQEEPPTVSESTVEYKTVYRRPVDGQAPPKGYKKRKCHRVRSEEIIEITSDLSHKKSESGNDERGSRCEEPGAQNPDEHEQTSDMSGRSSPTKNIHALPHQEISKPRYQSHPNNNGILQRYLKDSVKYRERRESSSTEVTSSVTEQDQSTCGVTTENTRCNMWDEYSSRGPRSETFQVEGQSRMYVSEENSTTNSFEETESVLPKRLVCQRNEKNNYKADFPEQERRGRGSKCLYDYNRARGKTLMNKNGVRRYEVCRKDSARKMKGYKCSYCEKVCSTPAKLTMHLKNCRIIVRSHFRRR